MINLLNELEYLSRAELSAVYFHCENLMYRGFNILTVTLSKNEKFFLATILQYNDKRFLDRTRNFSFYTKQELADFISILKEKYTFVIKNEELIQNDI